MSNPIKITPDQILTAYRAGLFPMAEKAEDNHFYWIDPELRGVLPINGLHVPKRLKRTVLDAPYTIKTDTDFEQVITECAKTTKGDREETWISQPIKDLFIRLHEAGYAHSVEAWDGDTLVGGLYGLALEGAFFGESMFSRARDASKIALVHLVARLWKNGFTLLDTQFVNPHLEQFGCYEIPRQEYLRELARALKAKANFYSSSSVSISPSELDDGSGSTSSTSSEESSMVSEFLSSLQSSTQTS